MTADIFVAERGDAERVNPPEQSVWLNSDGYYWHLYRYFEAAKVQRAEELVDLYGGAEIDGYELDRLKHELLAARDDATHKPDEWQVLTGWHDFPARENEIWKTVQKQALLDLIAKLLWLIDFAKDRDLKLIVSGD